MFRKNRVEEDLARIRHANLPDQQPVQIPEEKIGAKDILAMIIAAFSIVLPYVAVFVVILGFVVWVLTRVF